MAHVQSARARREFLRLLAAGAAILSTRNKVLAGRDSSPLAATALAENVTGITGAGSNVLLVTTSDGCVMVDGGLAERSADLMRIVSEQSGDRPVRVLFNTHWHPEVTGTNEAVAKAGAKIIAHENTRQWLTVDVTEEWQKRTFQPLPKSALPTETFYATSATSRKMTFGGQPIEYGYLPQAHTDGDIYVYFPQPNILMAGDIISVGSYPILDYTSGGWIGGMVQATKTLLKVVNADTRIIPGAGPVQTRADLEAESQMLSTVMERLVKLLKQGMSAKDMLAAAPTKEFDAKWGSPDLFIANAYPGLWGHVRELGGIV